MPFGLGKTLGGHGYGPAEAIDQLRSTQPLVNDQKGTGLSVLVEEKLRLRTTKSSKSHGIRFLVQNAQNKAERTETPTTT